MINIIQYKLKLIQCGFWCDACGRRTTSVPDIDRQRNFNGLHPAQRQLCFRSK